MAEDKRLVGDSKRCKSRRVPPLSSGLGTGSMCPLTIKREADMEVELPVLGSESGSVSQVCKRSTSNVDGCYRSNETINHATTPRRANYIRASALQRRLCMRHRRHVRVRVRVRVRLSQLRSKGVDSVGCACGTDAERPLLSHRSSPRRWQVRVQERGHNKVTLEALAQIVFP